MFTPGPTSQLAREHHRQMLADASRRQLRRLARPPRNQEGERRLQDHPPSRSGDCRCGHRGLTKQHHRAPGGPVAAAEPAAGRPASRTTGTARSAEELAAAQLR